MFENRKGLAKTRAAHGARWLDENFSGWEDRINPRTLNLADSVDCICGQVFNDEAKQAGTYGFSWARQTLFTEANAWVSSLVGMKADGEDGVPLYGNEASRRRVRVAVALGFQSSPLAPYWALQRAWVALLKERAAVAATKVPDEVEPPRISSSMPLPEHVDIIKAAERVVQATQV